MTIEVTPVGNVCNIGCTYCYEDTMRGTGYSAPKMNITGMVQTLDRLDAPFSVFGGEPLLAPMHILEDLFRFGWERFKHNGIQTNGVLINDEHIELFKKYSVSVGMSIDGPDELNDARWAGSPEKTREATKKAHAALERLIKERIPVGLIVTLHRLNASPERLPRLIEWFNKLGDMGLRDTRVHLMEIDSVRAEVLALTDDENIAALEALSHTRGVIVDVFKDIRALLEGEDERATCIWTGCDPYTTPGVQGVAADGSASNCGRANKDGPDWVKAEKHGMMRNIILASTPFEDGGCKGCKFMIFCKGNCPGEAIDLDWRNRSRYCKVWYKIFEGVETKIVAEGKIPVSLRVDLPKIEEAMVAAWDRDEETTIKRAVYLAEEPSRAGAPTRQGTHHVSVPHGDHSNHVNHTDLSGMPIPEGAEEVHDA